MSRYTVQIGPRTYTYDYVCDAIDSACIFVQMGAQNGSDVEATVAGTCLIATIGYNPAKYPAHEIRWAAPWNDAALAYNRLDMVKAELGLCRASLGCPRPASEDDVYCRDCREQVNVFVSDIATGVEPA